MRSVITSSKTLASMITGKKWICPKDNMETSNIYLPSRLVLDHKLVTFRRGLILFEIHEDWKLTRRQEEPVREGIILPSIATYVTELIGRNRHGLAKLPPTAKLSLDFSRSDLPLSIKTSKASSSKTNRTLPVCNPRNAAIAPINPPAMVPLPPSWYKASKPATLRMIKHSLLWIGHGLTWYCSKAISDVIVLWYDNGLSFRLWFRWWRERREFEGL